MNMPRSKPVLQFRLAMAGVTATVGEHESRKSCGTWASSAVSASVIDGVGPGAPVGGMVNGGKLMPGEVAGPVGGAVVAGAVVAGAVVSGAAVAVGVAAASVGVAVADAGVLVGLGVGVTCAAAVGDAAGAKGPSPNAYIPPTPNRSRTARPMAPITSNDGPPRLGGGAP